MAITKSQQTRKRKTLKEKECAAKDCKEMFEPRNMQHKTHHYLCAIAYQSELTAKRKKQENNREKKEFNKNDKATQMKLAQKTFNAYIRLRDKGQPCISCEHTGNRQIHAGHFMPVGSNGHIRFDEANCHAQCSICNNHKSGNLTEYEPNLIKKIGEAEVARLKIKFTRSYTLEELHEIIETYKLKTKELNDHSSSTGL